MKLRAIAALTVLALVLSVGAVAIAKNNHRHFKPGNGTLFATLLGKKEVSPTTGKKGAGDTNGRGGFTAVLDENQICWGLTVRNIDNPVAAHIHKGRPSVNGPIVVTLTAPSDGDPGASAGCTSISSDLKGKIQKNPHKYYVNVHTDDFPSGAIRGQISAKRR